MLDEFKAAPRALMTNARCLTEGVDVPAIDCVVFADPKQSATDIVQASGRAMRLSKGKKYGYIVVPIVVPENTEFAEFAETTAFRTIVRIITALSVHDTRIVDELRAIHHGRMPRARSSRSTARCRSACACRSIASPTRSRSRCGRASHG